MSRATRTRQTASAVRLSRSRRVQASSACVKRSSQAVLRRTSTEGSGKRRSTPRPGRTVISRRVGAIGRTATRRVRLCRCISGHTLPSPRVCARGAEWRRGTPPLRWCTTARRERRRAAERMLFGTAGTAPSYSHAPGRGIRTTTYADSLRSHTEFLSEDCRGVASLPDPVRRGGSVDAVSDWADTSLRRACGVYDDDEAMRR